MWNLHFRSRFSILPVILCALCLLIFSCKNKGVADNPVIIPTPTADYLKFQLSSANQMSISQISAYQYSLTTQGTDPYASLIPLSKTNPAASVVLSFEYSCSSSLNNIQLFFGDPITEARSLTTETIPASSDWKLYSIDIKDQIRQFNWGAIGSYFRMDFGNASGIVFKIRNIQLRARTAQEEAAAAAKELAKQKDQQFDADLKTYLATNFSSKISQVNVLTNSVTITGSYQGSASAALCELTPCDSMLQTTRYKNLYSLTSSNFTITLDRIVNRNGINYDRALSKWAIVEKGTSNDVIVSFARYADEIYCPQHLPNMVPAGRKGLGGFGIDRGFQSDLTDLGITSVTVNIPFTSYMYLTQRANTIAHTYGGKTYYFDVNQLNSLDRTLQLTASKNIVVAGILLVQKASECADPEVGRLLQHPNYTSEGIFTMPNMNSPASVNCYAAALDFLADRYCRSDNAYGRINHWIMHNEVDAGISWTNMGIKPVLVYLDTYMKSMRMCYNIVHQYDENAQVLGSFTHSWAAEVGTNCYPAKEMLEYMTKFNVEGDYKWGIAYHPYPEDLNEPKTWNDKDANFTLGSPLVTFKNLEVLNAWIKQPAHFYKGTTKRMVWLSENGTNSRSYSDADLKEQAAGFAYTWKKFEVLDGIDAILWHNWIDNRAEFGLRIGLRRFPDDSSDPGGRKPVWFAYQAAGTNTEDSVFDPYKAVIGITSWDQVRYSGVIQ